MRSLLFASLVLVSAQQAMAQGGYTAIAYDPVSGFGAQSNNGSGWFSEQDAETEALAKCQADDPGTKTNCQNVAYTFNGYISLYKSQINPQIYATGTGADRVSAATRAYNTCMGELQLANDGCVEVVYGYSFP